MQLWKDVQFLFLEFEQKIESKIGENIVSYKNEKHNFEFVTLEEL